MIGCISITNVPKTLNVEKKKQTKKTFAIQNFIFQKIKLRNPKVNGNAAIEPLGIINSHYMEAIQKNRIKVNIIPTQIKCLNTMHNIKKKNIFTKFPGI